MAEENGKRPISFQEILKFAPDNEQIFREIEKHLKAGANCMVPFVGAGLSAPVYKLWGGAIAAIRDKLLDPAARAECDALLQANRYLEAFQLLEDQRKPTNLVHDFEALFDPAELPKNRAQIEKMAVWLLPALFKGLAVTTNLDRMLEYVYDQQGRTFTNEFLPGERAFLQKKNLRDPGAHYLYKFHGTVEADGSLDYGMTVFTQRQYTEHYDPHTEAGAKLLGTLKAVYQQKPLLFLGCSLEQDRTLEVLREILEPGMENYAIVACEPKERDARRSALGDLGIRAVLYPKGRFEAVRVLLEQLLGAADPEAYRQLSFHVGAEALRTAEQQFSVRFQYDSGLYETVGREQELGDLRAFLEDAAPFRWWAVVGPGGTGKSRLALTLWQRLPEGWACRPLTREDYQAGCAALLPPGQNTLYVADYVQAHTDALGDFILAAARAPLGCKVRLLLLERDGGDWDRRMRTRFEGVAPAEAATFRPETGFLTLKRLTDEDLVELMGRYSEAVRPLSQEFQRDFDPRRVGPELLAALDAVDPGLRRPLYALFLTDAWLRGLEPRAWQPEVLLGHVLDNERRLLRERVQALNKGVHPDRLLSRVEEVLRFATALQDAEAEALSALTPAWNKIVNEAEGLGLCSAADLMARLGLGSGETVAAIRPDILGEYFVLRWLVKNPKQSSPFIAAIWRAPWKAAVFLDRITSDFTALLDEEPSRWELLLSMPEGHSRAVALVYAMLLMNAACSTQKLAVAELAVVRQETLAAAWLEDREIAVQLAKGLFNLLVDQDPAGRAATVRRLESLAGAWPEDREIAIQFAKGLVNLTADQDPAGRAATVRRLEALAAAWPEDREIAAVFARGLVNLTAVQDPAGCAATVRRLETLAGAWPEDREIAAEFARGLVNLTVAQDPAGCAATVRRLETLTAAWPKDREIAVQLAKGLVNLSNKQDPAGRAATVRQLKTLATAWPEDREIAIQLAKGLFNLLVAQDPADRAATVRRLDTLAGAWPEEGAITIQLVDGLYVTAVTNFESNLAPDAWLEKLAALGAERREDDPVRLGVEALLEAYSAFAAGDVARGQRHLTQYYEIRGQLDP